MGVRRGRNEATINTEDVMPMILRLCGRAVPKSVEGVDFSPAMRGEADPSGGATVIRCIAPFGEYARQRGGREYRGIRTARYTYVRDLNGPWLLYDNKEDPYQLQNLAGRPEHAALEAELDALLKKKLAEQHDEFRPATDYIRQWGWKVDASGTAPYRP
jgi:arylsulfatase A-like enzyme